MIDNTDTPSWSLLAGLVHRARRVVFAGAAASCLAPPVLAEPPETELEMARSAGDISLEQLQAFAQGHAPTARLAQSRRLYGAAARGAASPLLPEDPTLTLGAGPRFAGDERGVDFQASLAQRLEVAGERGLRRSAAARVVERLDAELALAELGLRRDVSVGYHAVLVAAERRALGFRVAQLAERSLSVARRQLEAGEATSIDVRIAEAEAARARAAELAFANELRAESIELALVVGWPSDTPPVIATGLTPAEPPLPLDAMLQRRRAEHPELRARQAAAREAHANVELADRRAWPSPTLALSFARESSFEGPANYLALGSVALPLPLWSRNRGDRAQSRADEAIANTEEALARRTQRAHLVRAHDALATAAARVGLLEGGASRALEEGLALLERSLEQGESSVLDTAVARERLAGARLETLAAYSDYYRARAELEYVVGASDGGLTRADAAVLRSGGVR
jgi:cobalt-zinc-cadmium efflux system outer membrane protein